MPNIINLEIVYDSTASISGVSSIDLNCGNPETNKIITSGIYDLAQNPPVRINQYLNSQTQLLTKIENCDGSYYLVKETYGNIADFVKSLCSLCINNSGNSSGCNCANTEALLQQIADNTANLTPEKVIEPDISTFTMVASGGNFIYTLLQSNIGIRVINSVTETTGTNSVNYTITSTNDVVITSNIQYPANTKIRISGQV